MNVYILSSGDEAEAQVLVAEPQVHDHHRGGGGRPPPHHHHLRLQRVINYSPTIIN